MKKIKDSKRDDIRVLNLFAYTGGATMACAAAGQVKLYMLMPAKEWFLGKRKYGSFPFRR